TNQLQLTDIDMLIPHQANLRINQMVAQMIGMPAEKTHNTLQKYGNTTAASIPICMHEAIELGKIKPGNLVCLVAFGAGLTWGSSLLRYLRAGRPVEPLDLPALPTRRGATDAPGRYRRAGALLTR